MVASGSIMDEPGKYISVNGARIYIMRKPAPVEQLIEMYRKVKDDELMVIPGANHFTVMEHPDLATPPLLDYIKRPIP